MTVYQVDYDLKEPGQNYEEVHETIKQIGDTIHPLESTWMVDTTNSTSEIRDELMAVADENDHITVVEFDRPYSFYLSSSDKEWIESRT